MSLHYGGSLWVPVLDRVLAEEIDAVGPDWPRWSARPPAPEAADTVSSVRIWPGSPAPLGANWDGGGTNIAVFAGRGRPRRAVRVRRRRAPRPASTCPRPTAACGTATSPRSGPGARYGFRVHGDRRDGGDVFNPAKLLLDPYARAIDGDVTWGDALIDNDLDSAAVDVPQRRDRPRLRLGGRPRRPTCPGTRPSSTRRTSVGSRSSIPACPRSCGARYLGVGVAGDRRAPPQPRGDGGRAAARPPLRARGPAGRDGPHQLLGLQLDRRTWRRTPPTSCHGRGLDARSVSSRRWSARCTAAGIEVILDVVYNHTAEGGVRRADPVVPRLRQPGLLPPRSRGPRPATSTTPAAGTPSTCGTPTCCS